MLQWQARVLASVERGGGGLLVKETGEGGGRGQS